nr:hypothetical protein [Sinorhizobium psoraleae]
MVASDDTINAMLSIIPGNLAPLLDMPRSQSARRHPAESAVHAHEPAAAVMDGAELAMDIGWAADDADCAALRVLYALAASWDARSDQRGNTARRSYDRAKAFVAVVGAAQVRRWVRMTKPNSPVSEHHAAVDVAWLPLAGVIVGEEGSQRVRNLRIVGCYQFGHLIV